MAPNEGDEGMLDCAQVLEILRDAIVTVDDKIARGDVTEDAHLQEGGLGLDSLGLLELVDEMQKTLDVDLATERFEFRDTGKAGPTVKMVVDRIIEVLGESGLAA
jgi:acyl carrier protein